MDRIAKLLKDAREDSDLSQMDVMKKTGISNKSLSRYENNMTEPDIETLSLLFKLYGLSLDSALGLSAKKTTSILPSPEEQKLIQQLRELPPELRNMIFNETDTLFSLITKK